MPAATHGQSSLHATDGCQGPYSCHVFLQLSNFGLQHAILEAKPWNKDNWNYFKGQMSKRAAEVVQTKQTLKAQIRKTAKAILRGSKESPGKLLKNKPLKGVRMRVCVCVCVCTHLCVCV
jgi:hypothetical protein